MHVARGRRHAALLLLVPVVACLSTRDVLSQAQPSATVRVAAISFVPQKFQLQANVERLERAFRDAKRGGAQIAVAPEGVLEGYVVNEIISGQADVERMRDLALPIDSPVIARFQELATELQLCMVFGFAEQIGKDVFNAAIFIDHRGRVCGKYHKMQLAEGYHPSWWFNRLGESARAFDTPYGRCGILICNDRWNPLLAKTLALDGAQFLVIPSFGSRSKSQDEAVLGRGRENNLPVIEANVGVTLVVDQNQIAAVDREEEGITFAVITIPKTVEVQLAARDQVEQEFLAWRAQEMPRRYSATRSRYVQRRAANDEQIKLTVGAYYYPWYRSGTDWMSRALRGRLRPQQLPKLGVYGSQDVDVIADHIKQSQQANISFWAVSWWGPNRRDDVNFRTHILKHPDAGKLKYAVLYESTGRFGSSSKPDYSKLITDFDYLARHYWNDPHYLKIDGKPVVFIYLTRVYFHNRGLEPLAKLRAKHPNVYLIGDDVFGSGYRKQDAELWDAVTAYDVYGQSLQRHGPTRKALAVLKKTFKEAQTVANEVGTAFIPAISPGFNDRAVRDGHVGCARVIEGEPQSREGDLFRAMIRDVAIPLVDDRADRIVMVTSFNEWYEDTQIEATKGDAGETNKDDSSSGRHYTESATYADYGDLYLNILGQETRLRFPQTLPPIEPN